MSTLATHRGFAPHGASTVAFAAVATILRWPFCVAEGFRLSRRLAAVRFDPPPVFIIGHWRSGTTALHNLMSRDPSFCFPVITDALRPFDFYPTPFESISRAILLRNLPPTRPMDDLPLSPDLPQEDEIALATMGAPSFFNCFYFPHAISDVFAREVLFEGGHPRDVARWRRCLHYYLAKLAWLHPGRRLLLKNPAHSARIEELRKLFPDAKFVHMHRDPLAVVASTRKLYRNMLPLVALQRYDQAAVDRHIVWAYKRLMDRLLHDLANVPKDDVVQLSHRELASDPMAAVESVYTRLRLPGFARARPAMAEFAHAHQHAAAAADAADRQLADDHRLELEPYRIRLGYSG